MVRHFDGLTVVNAGTLFPDHEPGYVVVDFSSGQVKWRDLATPSERVAAPWLRAERQAASGAVARGVGGAMATPSPVTPSPLSDFAKLAERFCALVETVETRPPEDVIP